MKITEVIDARGSTPIDADGFSSFIRVIGG
jgi:hypothetical protein